MKRKLSEQLLFKVKDSIAENSSPYDVGCFKKKTHLTTFSITKALFMLKLSGIKEDYQLLDILLRGCHKNAIRIRKSAKECKYVCNLKFTVGGTHNSYCYRRDSADKKFIERIFFSEFLKGLILIK